MPGASLVKKKYNSSWCEKYMSMEVKTAWIKSVAQALDNNMISLAKLPIVHGVYLLINTKGYCTGSLGCSHQTKTKLVHGLQQHNSFQQGLALHDGWKHI
jgi:hypothetical protein